MKQRIIAGFCAITLAVAPLRSLDAQGLPDLGESAQAEISPAAERRVGESFMRDMRWRDPAYLDDAEVEDYLNLIGGKLVAASQEVRQNFDFFAVRDTTLNAFAWPGGFIGVHTGLILAARSESELASVLAHEVSHVTQRHIVRMVGKSGQNSLLALAGLVIAVLAARGNSDVAQAAIATSQAAAIQSQLGYTREFEREADRVGLQTLQAAGYDARAMAGFFERLQQSGRLYENNAPSYLRTHPLTTERITDVENRVQALPYRQVPDSVEFHLVRAKLRAQLGTPEEALTDARERLADKVLAPGVAHYGLARALARAKQYAGAEKAITDARRAKLSHPMLESLAGEIRLAQGDATGAIAVFAEARKRFPVNRALVYAQVDALSGAGRYQEAADIVGRELSARSSDAQLYRLQARALAGLGKQAAQHRALAEQYALQGNLVAAVEQLQVAQKAGDGDFYENSAIDARMRQLKAQQAEEKKLQRGGP
ncbi:MAG TPA: M48 family metalloprotease [Rhodocyclaceae bacterium]|nr:M48 family metalloprotease [Rhodocyclaceae bacterium]HNA05134.1 M48 family metalloprotease [Rhodocyclaceae bacterium]HNB78404.1 M48 family metalloprotease [Rhodocyclaceae bacterium]